MQLISQGVWCRPSCLRSGGSCLLHPWDGPGTIPSGLSLVTASVSAPHVHISRTNDTGLPRPKYPPEGRQGPLMPTALPSRAAHPPREESAAEEAPGHGDYWALQSEGEGQPEARLKWGA